MQLVHCTVAHAGDPRHTVRKLYASVPEVILLDHIHGAGKKEKGDKSEIISEIAFAGERENVDELDILTKNYGAKQENLDLISRLFPGVSPTLPSTLSALGVALGLELSDPTEEQRTAVYRQSLAQADKDKAARIKAARADGRIVTEPTDDEVVPPPPARRTLTAAKAALA